MYNIDLFMQLNIHTDFANLKSAYTSRGKIGKCPGFEGSKVGMSAGNGRATRTAILWH